MTCSQDLSIQTLQVSPPFTTAHADFVKSEDWNAPLPQFLEAEGVPTDLTEIAIDIFVRPVYDHTALILRLSTATGTIVKDDATNGLASIKLSREVVQTLPVGIWDHFCVTTDVSSNSDNTLIRTERYRGRFTIHPGRT